MQQEHRVILAQKLGRLISGARLSHAVAILLLPFIGVVAAFGIAPDTVTEPVVRKQVVQELPLPARAAASSADEGYWKEDRVQRGDTLAELLARLGVDDDPALQFLRGAPAARPLYQLAPGRSVRALVTADGRLLALRYQSGGKVLSIERQGDTFSAGESAVELERRVLMKSGEIRSSLFAATDAAGLSDAIAMQVADIFSTDIDFHRDLRRGDHFSVVYEMFYDRGEPVRSGRVLAVHQRWQAVPRRLLPVFGESGRLLYARRQKHPQAVPAVSPRVLAHFFRIQQSVPSDTQAMASAQGHRLRGANRNARESDRRWHSRVRRTPYRRLRQPGGAAAPVEIHHLVRTSLGIR
jgi:hypothetical protein